MWNKLNSNSLGKRYAEALEWMSNSVKYKFFIVNKYLIRSLYCIKMKEIQFMYLVIILCDMQPFPFFLLLMIYTILFSLSCHLSTFCFSFFQFFFLLAILICCASHTYTDTKGTRHHGYMVENVHE